ncbi:putative parvulin-type peptidyl-prolyl cis-trans isomerase [Roseibaca ekhonensis]|jgi:peptidyl-prolyl cis-trans isomerase C|uniref:Parvulin-like PPIase n=1 Tax=Roseinatronobacter ekhonensis TaxID=254356 RepID=A0A3B0MT45_9RHOB|nr:peptidylprolyl isomerase [Roseibaca ekhonensis]SUZ32799.1 putative parvulin-type peptidyl-prolyl cis-trans isomerase [Roseibaca ekhonensis]
MVRISRALPAFALAVGLATGASAQEPGPETVVATVNGVEITVGHVLQARTSLPEQFQQMPMDSLLEPLVNQLIDQTALMQSVEGTLSVADEVALENGRRDFMANTALTRAAEAAISDEAIEEAYTAFVTEFDGREPTPEFNASHIIVETEEEAQALKTQLDEGADFAELARENSTDGAAANGGSLGWFGLGAMVQEFEEAVTSMEVGEIAGPLQTQFGWHLVILNDTRMSTAPAMEEVREQLVQTIQREAVEAEIARVTETADISRNLDALAPVASGDAEVLDE